MKLRAGDYERDPESGLMVPRRRGVLHEKPQWMGGPGFFRGSVSPNLSQINMQFDAGNGSQTFTDTGTAGSIWTPSGAGVVCSTGHVIAGVSSLFLPTNADYLGAPTSTTNRLPATANFSLKWVGYYSSNLSAGGTGGYLMSIQDTTPTAAGTQFAVATNASGLLVLVYSDGTTRSATTPTTSLTILTNTNYELKRVGTTLTLLQNSTAVATVTGFSGSFPAVTGRSWRIGKPEFGSNNALATGSYVDNLTLTY